MRVTRSALPPSSAEAAKTSPRAVNATFFPSGDSARSEKPDVIRSCSTPGPCAAPRSVKSRRRASPSASAMDQMPKSRSNTTVPRSAASIGQSSRPSVKRVSCRGAPPTSCSHRFSVPDRSDMYSTTSSAAHIAHRFFDPGSVRRRYDGAPPPSSTSQISASSMWLEPFRHHWLAAILARPDSASVPPPGDGDAKYSGW